MALVIWRHRPNIVRLLEGSEPRFTLNSEQRTGVHETMKNRHHRRGQLRHGVGHLPGPRISLWVRKDVLESHTCRENTIYLLYSVPDEIEVLEK
jgi:hypothetical protein